MKVLACCALVIPFAGTASKPSPKPGAGEIAAGPRQNRRTPIVALLREGSERFRAGHYSDALQTFEKMRVMARASGVDDLAARASGNVGGCQFALHQYRAALGTFVEAIRDARRAHDTAAAAIFNANIASLYSEMGELDAAAEWTQASLRSLSGQDRRDNEAKLLIPLASLRARQKRMTEALALFQRGLDAADRQGDVELYANGWNRLGEEYLKQDDLAAAERPLLEAYRIRLLYHLPLETSYRNLGLLRLEQGDLEDAGVLLDRAVELARRGQGPIPAWDVYHQRGRVRIAQGRLREALEDLRTAWRLARVWRWNMPADDTAQVGTEGWLEKVNGALVEAGNRLYLETHDPALARETFEVAEENRADSLRALLARHTGGADFPPAYWEALARLQRAEVLALRSPDRTALEAAAGARA
ncbi:MAG: tetratricopeptide repeat protein, partial [Acidobacteria bacterium]|nr:tetratricopeptide repeat protein [Acidobacteriota bacterium]